VGHSTITQVNVGPQLGGQSFSEIIFFKDKRELDNFKKGNYELNAQVEGIVVTSGVATTIDFSHGVAVFVLPKAGVMAEATVGGQKFSYRPY
jgi:lipid-binding SYLF domain-containing protein